MSTQTSTEPAVETIGKYRVHPVASMFPLLEGLDYDELRDSIEVGGQIYPIIVQGDLLLDGRNRLRACLDLKIDPIVQEYTGSRKPESFIESVNIDRRHLTDDMRGTIAAQIRAWRIEHLNAEQKAAARAAQALHGRTGGRGHKKPLDTNSYPRVSNRDIAQKNTNSTVGQIADAAKISHHKAAQAVAVTKAAPELAEKVAKGQMKLKDAHAQVKASKPAPPKPARKSSDLTNAVSDTVAMVKKVPVAQRGEFIGSVIRELWLLYCKTRTADPEAKLPAAAEDWLIHDVLQFLRNLRQTITDKRKEARAEQTRRQWNANAMVKLEMFKLIDFIEAELDKLPCPDPSR